MDEFKALSGLYAADSRPFWEACQRSEFLMQRCTACSRRVFYPRVICPHCGSERLDWELAPKVGTIYSFTHVHVAFSEEMKTEVPYTSVIIDFPEDVRMASRLLVSNTDQIAIGLKVEIDFVGIDDRRFPFARLI